MKNKLALTLCVATYGFIVPALEMNATHVFNPLWPEHARLHEVWQLATNCGIAAVCLWLAWIRNNVRAASLLGAVVPIGFLMAYVLAGLYGGSMRHTDGTELSIGGLNASVIVMGAATLVLFLVARSGRGTVLRR